MAEMTAEERAVEIQRAPLSAAFGLIVGALREAEAKGADREREQCCKDVCWKCGDGHEPECIDGYYYHEGEDCPADDIYGRKDGRA